MKKILCISLGLLVAIPTLYAADQSQSAAAAAVGAVIPGATASTPRSTHTALDESVVTVHVAGATQPVRTITVDFGSHSQQYDARLMAMRIAQYTQDCLAQGQPVTAAATATAAGKHTAQAVAGSTPLVPPQASPTSTPQQPRRMVVVVAGSARSHGEPYTLDAEVSKFLAQEPRTRGVSAPASSRAPSPTTVGVTAAYASPVVVLAMAPPTPQAAQLPRQGYCATCCEVSCCSNCTMNVSCCPRSSTPVNRV
ncbi:MAG TPA: hypothetical protein VLG71_03475 [Candidatus Limnocylindria bacterium]|nr:hypothetical protein [Candidatus Limnocylindria bacterium]